MNPGKISSMHVAQHLYVYYRVDPADSAALRARVEAMQTQLNRRTGQLCGLRRRPESGPDGKETWMEVYENLTPELEALLQEEVTRSGIETLIGGPRHSERFIDL